MTEVTMFFLVHLEVKSWNVIYISWFPDCRSERSQKHYRKTLIQLSRWKKSWVLFMEQLLVFVHLWGIHMYLETSIGLTKLRRCWFFSVVDISSLEGSCSLRKQFEIQVLWSFPRRLKPVCLGYGLYKLEFSHADVRFLRQGVADLVVIGESSALTRNQFWRWSHYLRSGRSEEMMVKRESSGLSLVPQWVIWPSWPKQNPSWKVLLNPSCLDDFFPVHVYTLDLDIL